MPTEIDFKNVLTGTVRFSYLTVFKPRANNAKENNPLEYSVVLLLPKKPEGKATSPDQTIAGIREAIKACAVAKFGDGVKGLKSPLKDGDAEIDGAEPKAPGYWYMTAWASADHPPTLIDGSKATVTSGWNSGDYGRAKLSFFAYDRKSGKGVSVGLRAIQFLYKGESLGGGGNNADGFDEVKDADSGSAGSGADEGRMSPDEYDPFADE